VVKLRDQQVPDLQTAVRTGNVLVIVSGSPGLVDAYLGKALAKAKAAH
jgi:hypothetical protein